GSVPLRGRGPERPCGCQPDAGGTGPCADALVHAERLAVRAEVGAAAALDDALDRRAAVLARLADAVVDEEDVFAALLHVRDWLRRILRLERRAERIHDGEGEPLGFVGRDRHSEALGMKAGAMQRLRYVDVAEPGERALVHQRLFQRPPRL